MGCFPCFDSKEEETLNPQKEVDDRKDGRPTVATNISRLSSGADRLKSRSNIGLKKDLSGAKELADAQIAAHTFTFRELAAATNNFRPESFIGEGGFGRVYKGRLQSTCQVVAVKQLDRNGLQGNREFLVEVLMLSLLHHPNLVNLIGYCADGDQRLLVYEFMPLGSLEDHLHDLPPDKEPLDWNTRMKIAAGAAKGLEFLHDKASPPVIYRDFKSSNILLEEGFHPKLSDFGLAKLGPTGDKSHVSTRVMGTYGYCAPEYAMTGQLTVKSDVYSFGVVFLELITGRKAIDSTQPQGQQNKTLDWKKNMKRALLINLSHYTRNHLLPSTTSIYNNNATFITKPLLSLSLDSSKFRFFSSEKDDSSSTQNPNPSRETRPRPPPETSLVKKQLPAADVEDVSNKELKTLIEKYLEKGDNEALPDILEAILKRKLVGKHEETDDELLDELLLDELEKKPLDNVKDTEFESDFEEAHSTDEEIDNLHDAMDIVKSRMVKDEFFNMDDKKWDAMVKEGVEHGILKDTRECEEILEDMLNWDKLLPDEIKKKVDEKVNEISNMIESGEIEAEKGYELFKEYEDKMVLECAKLMEAEGPPQVDETQPDTKKNIDDPPGEGPILRWQSRVVFASGGDAWHPKNRKVKMGVTVKELGLSKYQFRRLRELVGKRYHPGKDELMITSERFEHREENRKDCLRTLYSLIEEAGKADQLVQNARISYVKERLRANPQFMERLHAKTTRTGRFSSLPA